MATSLRKQIKHGRDHSALLLTGGGARAAYQVGVLKAFTHSLPRTAPLPFTIINGTSAGAINSTALACYASCGHLAVRKLEHVWKNFTTSQVYKSRLMPVTLHLINNMLSSFRSPHSQSTPASLLDNRPLRELLSEVLPFERIERNIERGFLEALSITASSYTSGDSISFFQSRHGKPWQRAKRQGIKTRLHLGHLMASSAIPVVFPSVKIRQQYYGDGSIHQMSPLSSAVHLGAKKIFIIGVEQPKDTHLRFAPHYPGMSHIAGHLLDSIFADTLQSDIERLERINRTLAQFPNTAKNQQELRKIDTLVINPSHNFNAIAEQYYDDLPIAIKLLLRTMGVKRHSESSLTSYLLFERRYTEHLIELGYQDGLEKLPQIREFLGVTQP